jgi:hypothetical protein
VLVPGLPKRLNPNGAEVVGAVDEVVGVGVGAAWVVADVGFTPPRVNPEGGAVVDAAVGGLLAGVLVAGGEKREKPPVEA